MAFVVEDGTGLANANAYVDLTYANAYFTDRLAGTTWSGLSDPNKQIAIVNATQYIDMVWGPYFKGCRMSDTQALEFPRDAFLDTNGVAIIPEALKKATCEYAIRASAAPLAPDIEQDPSGYQVSRRFEKLGPIEERTDFAFLGPGASRKLLKPYPAADMLLRTLMRSTQGRVIRN